MDAIKALYTDPKKGFVGQTKLVHKLGATQKKGDLRKFYANADKLQMNRKVRKPDHYLRITGPPYSFQIDVMFLRGNLDLPEKYGDKMLLVLIDILSRKAYIDPVHDNKLPTLIKAYAKFLGDMDEFRDGNKALAASVMRDRDESNAGSLVASVSGDDEFKVHFTARASPACCFAIRDMTKCCRGSALSCACGRTRRQRPDLRRFPRRS